MITFRTKKTHERYIKERKLRKDIECPLCNKEVIKAFKYWKIIENRFPYDRVAKKHHMIIPIRHAIEDVLTKKEMDELREIKKTFIKDSDYAYIMETTPKTQSVPGHFHLHLITLK